MTIGASDRKYRDSWTADMDALLMDAIGEGSSFSRAGTILGITKDQAAKRFNRLAKRMGWQAI
jgi:hypothetical protein